MHRLTIEERTVELESSFTPRLWSLVQNSPALYDALLDRLQGFGLSSIDLRPDTGDGSIGGAGLGFWLFGGKANVRIGLDSVRFRSTLLSSDIVCSVDRVLASIREASPELQLRSHALSYSCHGGIDGTTASKFVGRIVPIAPAVEGFGSYVGAGAAFYFGEALPIMSSTLTLEVSQTVPDGLFARVFILFDGSVGSGSDIEQLAEERVRAALGAVDLEIP